ncbi:MAG TPA: amidohydrolase family protein [Rugosimonospora sp.]|nr:amidohydrolase family protein [Rugosimonospora sp.]
MIIDCHGHYTTAPAAHQRFRDAQLAWVAGAGPAPERPGIGDDEIRASIEDNQLRILRERGGDLMVFSPKASAMGHHIPDAGVARDWAQACNDLTARVVALFPDHFAGVCQLPQTPDGGVGDAVAELTRCVGRFGFVGCNLNPDPSGGWWTAPPMTDRFWYPVYEALVALDVPAMIHVSASTNPAFHDLGAHYLNADTTVFMQLLQGDLFRDFPTLRLVIPHGGGAVPYHWGRFNGLATRLERPPLPGHLMGNVFFDTAVYHQPGIDLLTRVIATGNILFASEMLGAVRGTNPETGHAWDDTKRYLDAAGLDPVALAQIYEGNARRVYPRLPAASPARPRG